jgi:hypothetical protein
MKKYLPILVLCLALSCQKRLYTGESMLIKPSTSGTIALSTVGYGTTKSSAYDNGIKNVFKNILLKGIPNSNQSTPLLGDNAEMVYKKKGVFFADFFENHVEEYIMSKNVSNFRPTLKEGSLDIDLKINTASLRRMLENNKIIRKFGL